MANAAGDAARKARENLPVDDIGGAAKQLLKTLMTQTVRTVGDKAGGLAERLDKELTRLQEESRSSGARVAATGAKALAEGRSPVKAGARAGVTEVKEKVKDKAKGLVGAGDGAGEDGGDGKGGGGDGTKAVNIVEEFDVGLPLRVAYNQWTRFEDFPTFTKNLESVEQESDEKLNWRAKIFFSHRDWKSTIIEQIPDERIVWRSEGAKGWVDGAVTFHELAPNLTRILLVAEYHPDGFFEKTANLWKAQGRRLRLEFKNIKRHMMMNTLVAQDDVEGWRGEIRDGRVVKTHEEAMREAEGGQEAAPRAGEEKAEEKAEGKVKGEDEEKDEGQGEQRQEAEPRAQGEQAAQGQDEPRESAAEEPGEGAEEQDTGAQQASGPDQAAQDTGEQDTGEQDTDR